MFMQTFIKLSAVVHELSCKQRNREKKLSDNAENNTAITAAGSNSNRHHKYYFFSKYRATNTKMVVTSICI